MYVYGISVSGVFDDKSEGCVGEKVRVLTMGSIPRIILPKHNLNKNVL